MIAVPRRVGASVLVLLAVLAASCERRTTLVPPPGDSTAVLSGDSSRALIRDVQRAWDQRADLEQAADLTSKLLLDEFRRIEPAGWVDRAEALCDSLGIGVETAGSSCALAVNLFLRSDPAAGSWPYLLWCSGRDVRLHALEGRNLRLLGAAARADSGAADPTSFVALYARSRGSRLEPLLNLWTRPRAGDWRLFQTLGPDSLGGTGSAELVNGSSGVEVVTRTYHTPPGFEECPTCPHVFWTHRFRWGEIGFERLGDAPVPSAYATFVQFIQALSRGEGDPVIYVTDPALIDEARRLEWQSPRGAWRIAPKSEEAGNELTFFRGPQEAYLVRFVTRDEEYLISGFEIVPRTVE